MEENCANTPNNVRTASEASNKLIKIERVSPLDKENSDEKDEASMDKSSDAHADQNDASGREEYFLSNALLNYPYANKLWNESSTRLFLKMYKELKEKYEKGESSLKHRQRFTVIAENLKKFGFEYTVVQVENRFKSLKRSYQKKIMREEVLDKEGNIKPSHPASQYHLYAEDMHEIFADCVNEMREAAANSSCPELHATEKEAKANARKRKLTEISLEDQTQSEEDDSGSRSEGFHNGPPNFIQHLQSNIPETITCTTDDIRFPGLQEGAPSFQFPNPGSPHVEDAVEELRLLREDYNTWQKIREDGKNRRHQEKMTMYSQLIQAITRRK